jgi:hypothetical protein
MLNAFYWLFVFPFVIAFILGFMSYGIIPTPRPKITGKITVAPDPNNGNNQVLTIPVSPVIGQRQQVKLLLKQLPSSVAAGAEAQTYSFDAPSRDDDTSEIAISVSKVPPGEYLVQLEVDSVETLLEIAEIAPTVTLP